MVTTVKRRRGWSTAMYPRVHVAFEKINVINHIDYVQRHGEPVPNKVCIHILNDDREGTTLCGCSSYYMKEFHTLENYDCVDTWDEYSTTEILKYHTLESHMEEEKPSSGDVKICKLCLRSAVSRELIMDMSPFCYGRIYKNVDGKISKLPSRLRNLLDTVSYSLTIDENELKITKVIVIDFDVHLVDGVLCASKTYVVRADSGIDMNDVRNGKTTIHEDYIMNCSTMFGTMEEAIMYCMSKQQPLLMI